jgi:hypothetical protein
MGYSPLAPRKSLRSIVFFSLSLVHRYCYQDATQEAKRHAEQHQQAVTGLNRPPLFTGSTFHLRK